MVYGSNEVIIDGVNVAECNDIYGKEWINPQCLAGAGWCKDYPNCYFKQLQRAKAELEQYKKSKQASYENMQEQWNNAINENRLLKAALKNKNFVAIAEENERLKAENENLKSLINTHLTTFDKCCVNGLIMSNNMSEELNEQNDR